MSYKTMDLLGGFLSLVYGITAMLPTSVGRSQRYLSNMHYPNLIPDPADLIVLYRKGYLDAATYHTLMKYQGFAEENSDALYEAGKMLAGAGDLITLYRREEIDLNQFIEGMMKIGYDGDEAAKLFKSTEFFPSAPDLVRFAVREVYTPEIIEKFDLDADLPERFLVEAAKAGMSQEQAINYWRSHWILPSVQLGYEMLHRDVISEEDLDLLFRTQDVMPFWRDKLKAISYTPYTRVDVRRMYSTGVLTKDDVFRSYKDIGYDDIKADKMTEFAIAYAEPTERALTRAMIIAGYEQGELKREECIAFLVEIGYDAENADYIVSLEENKWREKDVKNQIATLTTMFKGSLISQAQYIDELDKLNLKSSYRNKLVAGALTAKKTDTKLPTKADVREWLKLEMIDTAAFRTYFDRLGYLKSEIDLYLEEIFLERLEEIEIKSRQEDPKLIPRATLTGLFLEKTIDEERLRAGFKELRFRDVDIDLLVSSAKLKAAEMETEAEKEED